MFINSSNNLSTKHDTAALAAPVADMAIAVVA